MIPKIIHYCWFGRGEMPQEALRCIASWKEFLPEYGLTLWNEDNFDLDAWPYAAEAYKARKYAFVTDVVRLYALVHFGGVYMDTDVEVLKPLDPILGYEAVSGFESETRVPTGLMASEPHHPFMESLLREYEGAHFLLEDGSPDLSTNVIRITRACIKEGLVLDNTLQTVGGFTLLPKDWLCPKDLSTRELHLTANSLCIHHFDGSWQGPVKRFVNDFSAKHLLFLPSGKRRFVARVIGEFRYNGFRAGLSAIAGKIKEKTQDSDPETLQ